MELDEQSLFLFCGCKADRIKALYWDGTGYILLYKRMANQGFKWPRNQSEVRQITKQQLTWLLDGLSVSDTTVSRITDKILPVAKEWQQRPVESIYAVVFLDAIHYHVRSEGQIVKKAAPSPP